MNNQKFHTVHPVQQNNILSSDDFLIEFIPYLSQARLNWANNWQQQQYIFYWNKKFYKNAYKQQLLLRNLDFALADITNKKK